MGAWEVDAEVEVEVEVREAWEALEAKIGSRIFGSRISCRRALETWETWVGIGGRGLIRDLGRWGRQVTSRARNQVRRVGTTQTTMIQMMQVQATQTTQTTQTQEGRGVVRDDAGSARGVPN